MWLGSLVRPSHSLSRIRTSGSVFPGHWPPRTWKWLQTDVEWGNELTVSHNVCLPLESSLPRKAPVVWGVMVHSVLPLLYYPSPSSSFSLAVQKLWSWHDTALG